MEKLVLTPEECGNLTPHGIELIPRKCKRLSRMTTRKSRFNSQMLVMSSEPILIFENYILNGKHRSVLSFRRGIPQEAYSVESDHEIIFHTPHKAYGEGGLDDVLNIFHLRDFYIRLCGEEGVRNIADLAKLYPEFL